MTVPTVPEPKLFCPSPRETPPVSLLGIFATAILPIVAVAAVGYALGRFKNVEADALNTITVYVLAPALVLHSLATSELGGGTILAVVGAVGLFTAVMLGVGVAVGRLSGQR
jgi:predicted permease